MITENSIRNPTNNQSMKTNQFQARQGDVIIERIAQLPPNAKEEKVSGRIILAHGEVTGHAHAIAIPQKGKRPARLFRVPGEPETIGYLEIAEALNALAEQDTVVKHDEHDPIPLAPGVYRFRRQREYAPEAPRIVAD